MTTPRSQHLVIPQTCQISNNHSISKGKQALLSRAPRMGQPRKRSTWETSRGLSLCVTSAISIEWVRSSDKERLVKLENASIETPRSLEQLNSLKKNRWIKRRKSPSNTRLTSSRSSIIQTSLNSTKFLRTKKDIAWFLSWLEAVNCYLKFKTSKTILLTL